MNELNSAQDQENAEEKIKINSVSPIKVYFHRLLLQLLPEKAPAIPKLMFQEGNLVSAFTMDCPPDLTNASYRLLHRLGISYYNSSGEESEDSPESEEDFYFEVNPSIKKKQYNIPKLLTMYSLRDTVSVLRLLLESRFAIPICCKDTIELLRITQRLEEGIFLGEDKRLPRVAIISQVKSFDSYTGKIMEDLFNLKTSFDNVETSSIEIGQGFVCCENQNLEKKKENYEQREKKNSCIVIHIRGNFEPYWKFLADFIDYLVVEDEFISETNKLSHFMSKYSNENYLPQFITIWIPNLPDASSIHRPFYLIEGSLHHFVKIQRGRQLGIVFHKVGHHEHSLHTIFPFEGSLGHIINNLRHMYLTVSTMDGLDSYRSDVLQLQKSFAREYELHDKSNEFHFSNDMNNLEQMQKQISEEQRFRSSLDFKNDPLIRYFLKSFEMSNIDHILLHIRVLSDAIATNIKNSKIVAHLNEDVIQKTKNFAEIIQVHSKGSKYEDQIKYAKKVLSSVKEIRNRAFLSIRHLWREASLFYSSGTNGEFLHLPQMAASCLIAGETLELYDGDANMINVDWITAIFRNLTSLLPNKKVFVLSVLGEQSSGKSTLLNTMFGIQLATSIGQCTRGLTMTLVKTINRKEYDYVIVFDSEGVRSPEHTGIYGCVKRDNKIATLSILPSDAVILVVKGENDNALKEILPIVVLAYKGSKLAEERGGMLGCKLFAAYNQIKCDEENEHMLQNIFSKLSTTVIESCKQIESLQDLNVHTPISFPKMFSCKEDIQVLGCNTKGDQPNDVPNEDFSLQIVNFREHIHKQVVSQVGWSAQNFKGLENCLLLVWKCLNESNFELSFQSVIERHNYTELESKYQTLKDIYCEAYEKESEVIMNNYKEQKSLTEEEETTHAEKDKILEDLEVKMRPDADKFNIEINKLFKGRQNSKWKTGYLNKVEAIINFTTSIWRHNLELFLRNQLLHDIKVSNSLREIKQKVIEDFKTKSIHDKPREQLISVIDKSFNVVMEAARKENPEMDVRGAVRRAYEDNRTIQTLGINLLDEIQPSFWQTQLNKAKNLEDEILNWISQSNDDKYNIEKMIASIIVKITRGRKYYSNTVVSATICEIERSLMDHHKKIDKSERKIIHRNAYDLLVDVLVKIQENWERENSAYGQLHSKKEVMQAYCLEVANSLKEVDIMALRLNDFFQKHTIKGFQSEVKENVMGNLKKQRWLKSPKTFQGHMDLYLMEEVEPKGIRQVLKHIKNPSKLKRLTKSRLIRFEIDRVLKDMKLINFQDHVKFFLKSTYEKAPVDPEFGLKSFQFNEFFKFLKRLKSTYIADELKRDMMRFSRADLERMSMKFQLKHITAMIKSVSDIKAINNEIISKEILSQIQQSSQFEAIFCRSCSTSCPICKSPCSYEVSHKGKHDASHQPFGLIGIRDLKTKQLRAYACNTAPINDFHNFPKGEKMKYTDFSKKFSSWLQPDRAKPVAEYRKYLIHRYNKEIANFYSVNPTDKLGKHECHNIVKNNIKRNVDFYKDFPGKT